VVVGGVGDAGELGGGILVAGPQALEVEHAEAAEPTELDRGLGRHQGVHGGGEDRDVEVVRVHLPGGGDVLRVPGAAGGDHRHVVQAVAAPSPLVAADLDLAHHTGESTVGADRPGPRGAGGRVAGREGSVGLGGLPWGDELC